MKILNNYILIKKVKEKRNVGGLDLTIILDDEDRFHLGEVINVGISVVHVKIGDEVFYDKHRGANVTISGVRHIAITEQDIIAIK